MIIVLFVIMGGCAGSDQTPSQSDSEWISLWDGESFDGWRASENPESFQIEDGKIVVNGPRAHLFYDGPVGDADFQDFEFRAEVYTYPGANSGIYFHTQYQDRGWPSEGYEAQVNATHNDPRKTGSLYGVNNVMNNAPHDDEEWFTYTIRVEGRNITFKVDDATVMEYTVPENGEESSRLGSGTIALQAHDPDSRIYYRNLQIRLPD
ncbi:MAG: DUF1080 domain-containing protein [Balneolaceae bacterium]|nr:DUF1080 domain-containing protein [Balneolaceae bacterium]